MSRRVLMIACNFPPTANVSAHRPGKYAKYLPNFGWTPVVLSRDDRLYRTDPTLARGIDPSTVVERVRAGDLRHFFGFWTKLGLARFAAKLRSWFSLPDDQWGWAAAVVTHGTRMLRIHKPDAVLCSCVPLSSAVGAALLRRSHRVPLILDYHNEWTRNMYYDPPTPIHARAQRRLEEWVASRADSIVTLNPLHTEDYAKRFPGTPVRTIHNGYDPDDLAGIGPPRPAEGRPVVFTYAGAVYGFQSPAPVVRAFERLLSDGRLKPEDVEVRVLGDPFRAFQADGPVRVVVEHDVPHAELVRHFSQTDYFFLCLEPEASRQLPAKLYEYLATGRPTLVVAPAGGAAARLVAETGGARVVETGLEEILLDWVRAAREGRAVCEFRDLRAFERRNLARQMGEVLDQVTG